jgi:hypothetical protein
VIKTRFGPPGVVFFAMLCLGAPTPAPGGAQAPASPSLSDGEIETFLLTARIVRIREVGQGVTNSRRATLSDGTLTHDAHVQTVDVSKVRFEGTRGVELNFRDSYRSNIAAYRLARHLGLPQVPVSVERRVGAPASVTWWVDDVMMDEGQRRRTNESGPEPARTAAQIHIMRVFDELIANVDRNAGNLLWTRDWTMWMIDHTRGFRITRTLLNPALLERCERRLLAALRDLSRADLDRVLNRYANASEKDALLARRDLIVRIFDDRIAEKGESSVLYTYPPDAAPGNLSARAPRASASLP